MKNLNKLLLPTLIIGALSTQALSNDEIKTEAINSIKKVAGALQSKLKEKMKNGGPVEAATFCSTNATALAKEVSKILPKGVKVKRITDKPRNINNQASKEQLAVLAEIKEKLNNKEKLGLIVKKKAENQYDVYKPIVIQNKCLTCHGSQDVRNEKAYDVISKKYPNDKAVNYKLGDLRGAFLVTIIK